MMQPSSRWLDRARCAALAGGYLAYGCLANDSRPPPGSVTNTASSDTALQEGFTTADGFSIHYDQFLASLGNVSPEGDDCTFYSDAAYNRVLDMRLPKPQRLSIFYALGQCEIDFEVSSPWQDSVLGQGVTAKDRDFMRTPASDDEVADAAISIYVAGTATAGAVQKRFAWAFRQRLDHANCYFFDNDKLVYGAKLSQGSNVERTLTVHGTSLFQDHLEAAAAELRFAAFASADDERGDADGNVTLEELGRLPLSELADQDQYADAAAGWKTLEDYVYRGLFPRIVRYQGDGDCEELEVAPNDRVLR